MTGSRLVFNKVINALHKRHQCAALFVVLSNHEIVLDRLEEPGTGDSALK